MTFPWMPLLGAALGTALLVPATRWFARRLQSLVLLVTGSGAAAMYTYYLILLPGTLLHEGSHWLVARLLGVRTGRISLRPVVRGAEARFGAVAFERTDALRASLIGVAPLVMGTLAIWLIASFGLGMRPSLPLAWSSLPAAWRTLRAVPDVGLWLYLLVAIANAMLPSAADRQAWGGLVIYVVLGIGALVAWALLSRAAPTLWPGVARFAQALLFTYALTLILDLALGLTLWAIEALLGLALGRRVVAN